MLHELHIKNLAVIDELTLEFAPGLNVLTGETGAGKSIILGALGLIIGQRGGPELVRTGEDFARVEASIDFEMPPELLTRLHEAGVETDGDEPLIVTRRVSAAGRTRAQLNGCLTTNAILQALGEACIDIHGQHEHQSLFRVQTHMDLLDAFADVEPLRRSVGACHDRILTLRRELRDLQQNQRAAERERELLTHEVEELDKAALREGEEEKLDAERRRLLNAEKIHDIADSLYTRLQGAGDEGVLEQLRTALTELQALRDFDDSVKPLETRLDTVYFELEDVALQLSAYRDDLDPSPARLSTVGERLDLIYQLKRKYGDTVSAVLRYHDEARDKLRRITGGAESIRGLAQELRAELRDATEHALALSDKRQAAARELEKRVVSELAELGMDKAEFHVSVQPVEAPNGLIKSGEKSYKLGAGGVDDVEFLIAPNLGETPRPLNRIASGGEISRVMLALKTVLAEMDRVSTLVFDEVDSGIGGATAAVVGRKLRQLAESRQVVCITHLPQIAAMADRHFRVEKTVEGDRTRTTATRLDEESRVAELAQMLGGDTKTSRAHARELMRATATLAKKSKRRS